MKSPAEGTEAGKGPQRSRNVPKPRTTDAQPPSGHGDRAYEDIFASYALAVEMADRVSARRGSANTFFLTIQTSLLTAVAVADTTLAHVVWYSAVVAAVAGCAISVAWWLQLKSYRRLNQAKFEVINRLEEQLPAKLFTDEWVSLKAKRPASSHFAYIELGTTERLVPGVLAGLHILLLLGRLLG